jgi:acyl carrier protein
LCRKAFISETLDVVYRKSFKTSGSLEIEQTPTPSPALNPDQVQALRAMDKTQIVVKLSNDVAKLGSVPAESIDVNASLVSILDSLTISQFKGLLEAEYAVKISDEYLFRENTTLSKLVEVVKQGHALDDGEGDAPAAAMTPSNTGGLSGALGCPPGVVCCIVM